MLHFIQVFDSVFCEYERCLFFVRVAFDAVVVVMFVVALIEISSNTLKKEKSIMERIALMF